jgi:hypothetical protein
VLNDKKGMQLQMHPFFNLLENLPSNNGDFLFYKNFEFDSYADKWNFS